VQNFLHWFPESLVPEYAVRAVGALVILVVGWLAVRFVVGPFRRVLDRSRIDPSVASFLANSVRSAIIIVLALTILHDLGIPTASLLALVGAAGLAIALALQGSLANFASGLLILSFRTVRVGDLVEIGDVRGRVDELLPFHVVLVTLDNQRITVPNTSLTSGPVRNHSALAIRRAQWKLPLAPQDDLARVKEALRARLLADGRVLPEPNPELFIDDWAADKRILAVAAWTRTADYLAVQQGMLENLGLALDAVRRSKA
jgi:small conductance mechanosensitive channel